MGSAQLVHQFCGAKLLVAHAVHHAHVVALHEHQVAGVAGDHLADLVEDALDQLVELERAAQDDGRLAQGFGSLPLLLLGFQQAGVFQGQGHLVADGLAPAPPRRRSSARVLSVFLQVQHADNLIAELDGRGQGRLGARLLRARCRPSTWR